MFTTVEELRGTPFDKTDPMQIINQTFVLNKLHQQCFLNQLYLKNSEQSFLTFFWASWIRYGVKLFRIMKKTSLTVILFYLLDYLNRIESGGGKFIFISHSLLLFVCLSNSRFFFYLYGEAHITDKGLHILTCTRQLWPLKNVGYLACHTYNDTGHPFKVIIFENPRHWHLFSSV